MQSVKVKVKGVAPLLMNRYPMEKVDEPEASKRRDEIRDPVTDANTALYREEGLGCYAPSTWLEASLREAGKVQSFCSDTLLRVLVMITLLSMVRHLPTDRLWAGYLRGKIYLRESGLWIFQRAYDARILFS